MSDIINADGVFEQSMITNPETISSGSSLGYAPYAAGISLLSSIAGDFASTSAFKANINAQTDAKIANMKSMMTSYELEQVKLSEQIGELDEVLGDKLSARGLASIKSRALLKAAAAETGTSGGTTDYAAQEAYMNEHFDRANIISETENRQKSIMSSMGIKTQRLKSDLESIASGTPSVQNNTVLSALTGGLGVFTNTLSMMPTSEKDSLFDIKPQGS